MIRLTAAALVCIVMASTGAWAVEIRSGGSVVFGNQQPLTQDVVAAGSDVSVRPVVQGNVTIAGQTVAVSGPVRDSIFAAGRSVTVTGKAGNDVRLAGKEVSLAAPVGNAAYLAGSTVRVLESASIGSDLLAAGKDIRVVGSVGGDARLAGDKIVIGGPINGNVYARGNQISLLAGARINGNFFYESPNAATISPGAVVKGKTVRSIPPQERMVHVLVGAGLVAALACRGHTVWSCLPGAVSRKDTGCRGYGPRFVWGLSVGRSACADCFSP